MLESIRKRTASWVVKALLLLLVLSFAVWGIGDIFRGGREQTVATVDDINITNRQLNREFRREMNRIQHVFENALTSEQAREMGLLDRALDRMIAETVFDLESHELHLIASDSLVAARIKDNPAFRDRFGEFDRQIFYQLLLNNDYTEEQFTELVRRGITRNQLAEAVTHGTVVPERLGTILFKFLKEERTADMIAVPASRMKGVGQPDAEALTAYYEEHSRNYMSPEYRGVTAIVLAPDDFLSEIEVPEEEIQREYDARLGELSTPERREIEQILLSDEESATKADVLLTSGTSFEKVAQEIGRVEKNANLSLGSHARDELISELSEPAFALKKGEISKPIQSSFGWHILRVKEITPGSIPKLEDVREQIVDEITRGQAIDSLYAISTQLEDRLAGGATLEEASKELDLPIVRLEKVSSDGKTPEGKPAEALPDIDDFLTVAYETAAGEESTMIETKEGGFFILRVDAITPTALRPLEEIREQAVADWQAEERTRKAEALAVKIIEDSSQGKSLRSLAANSGLRVKAIGPLTRDGEESDENLTAELIDKLFAAKADGVVMAPTDDGYAVAKVKEILEADIGKDTEALENVRTQVVQSMANDILDQYIAALRKKYPVKIYPSAIESAY
ncbi:MAG: SurA N-terminal domain-containing protein [Alphaproteobacteria bacterium]|nr:SurA N-terminal domain-containing protein [Alphaproteobacteria bacterium]